MTPRKTILRELAAAPNGRFMRPSDIPGFATKPPKYREAVNGLLKDQLITGSQDEDGNLVVAVSPQRLDQVNKELRPWFRAPAFWGAVLTVGLLIAARMMA